MSKCFKHISSADDKLEILKISKALVKNDGSVSKNDSLVQAAEQLLSQYSEQEQQIIQYVLDNKPVEIKGSDELVAQVEEENTQPTETKAPAENSESQLNKETQSSNDQANNDGQKTSQSDTFDPLKIKNTQTQLNNRGGYKLIDTDTGREVFEGRSFKTKSEGNKLLKKMQQEALNSPEKKAMFSNALPETITIDGKERSTTNSNGQPIAQTEEGIKNFWNWFGDSKVVDEQGRPLVVYHGTKNDFAEFTKGDIGYHFGTTQQANVITNRLEYRDGNARILGVYLTSKNIIRMPDVGFGVPNQTLTAILDEEYITKEQAKNIREEMSIEYLDKGTLDAKQEALKNELIKLGFDGIVYKNTGEPDTNFDKNDPGRYQDSYIVFSPNQIKSAIGNNGDFSADNNNILKSTEASKADTKITGSTVEQVLSWLPSKAKKLVDKGIIVIVQSIKDIPASVEGFYETGSDKIYLIADSLNAKNIGSVLAHELLHRALIIDPKLKVKVDGFRDYFFDRYKQASKGLGSSIENMAYKRIINAKTLMEDRPEEFMAYMVSEYMRNPNMLVLKMKRAIERFIGHIRAILIRSGLDLGLIKELTPADLSAMAMRYGTSIQGKGKAIGTDKYSVAMPTQITNVAQQGDAWLKGFLSQANKDIAIYNLQDRFIDLKRQMERVVEDGGVINEEANPYLAEELYHQSRQSLIDDFYADEVQPVLNTMHDEGIGIKELEEFLHARHAPSRNSAMAEINPSQDIIDQKIEEAQDELDRLEEDGAKPKEIAAAERELRKWQGAEAFYGTEEQRLSLSGMSDEAAADYMDSLEPERLKSLERLGDAMDAINNKTLDIMIDYGLETQETIDTWKRKWDHYVPLHRDEAHPENGNFGHPVGKGFSISGNGVRQATGSNADVTNIMAHVMAAREQMITRGQKNKVEIALANFIIEHPDPDFAEVNKLETHKKIVDGLVEDVRDPFFVQKEKRNVVSYRENGKDRLIVFNEKNPENLRLALSLKNMDGVELDKVESIIGNGTRWLASVNTQYNLVFGIFNLMRDTQGMALNLESTALHGKQKQVLGLMPTAIKTIFNITRGGNADPRIAKLYDDFRHDGGTTGFVHMFDTIEKRSRSLQGELDKIGEGKVLKSWHWIFKAIEDFNTVMENGTRFAAYMAGRDAGLSRMESASLSKNITVNFNRKGAYTTKLGAFYAFFNASMQGTFRTVETLSSDKGKQIMAGGVALGAVTTLLGIAAMGDDEWEKIPEFVRERSLIIPTGKKSYVAIPMPLGFHLLPNIGRKFVESFLGSDRVTPQQRLLALAGSTVGAFNPLGGTDISNAISFTVTDPAVALWRNKDWTGKPVYREDYNSLKPTPGFTRTKDSATWGSKAAAELINKATGGTDAKQGLWSPTPDQIDYLIGQIAGGTGREIMKAEQIVESAFTGEELPTYKIPLVGRLIGSTGDGAVEATAYYDNLKRLNEHEAEIKYLKENGNARAVISYTQDNPEVKILGFAANVEKTIDRMKKQRRVLISRGGNSKVIDQAINAQMKKLNDKLLTK